MKWIKASTNPPESGYYIAAWNDEGHWRVSELWYNPNSHGSGWWPSRNYMARFVGDAAITFPRRSLTVAAWMQMPKYPGLGPVIAYKTKDRHNGKEHIWAPEDVTIIHEGIIERGAEENG